MDCNELYRHPSLEKVEELTPFQREYQKSLEAGCKGFPVAKKGPVEVGSFPIDVAEPRRTRDESPKAKLPTSAIGLRLRF